MRRAFRIGCTKVNFGARTRYSPHYHEMFEAVVAGATDPDIEGVEVLRRPALTVSPVEMLEADGYLLGTPANLGYISGALKDDSAGQEYACGVGAFGRV